MPLFRKKRTGPSQEHAVILHYRLSGDEFGTDEEREAVRDLEGRLEAAVVAAGAGEYDGNEFGQGEVVLYLYGSDKDRLWAAVEQEAREFPLRPAFALLRAGGPDVAPEQVNL